MTKEVIVSIKGVQQDIDENESISILTKGEYYLKNGIHYVLYEEKIGECENMLPVRGTIKLSENKLEIIRRNNKAGFSSSIVLKKGSKEQTFYNTPYGSIEMVFDTLKMETNFFEEEISVKAVYVLIMNGGQIGRHTVAISIKAA